VETLIWAAINRETDIAKAMIHWTSSRANDLDDGTPHVGWAAFQSVPAAWRQWAGTPERLLAFAHANSVEPFGAVQVTKLENLSSESANVAIRLYDDTGNFKDEAFQMLRTRQGWKRVHWPYQLEALAQRLHTVSPPK
jgi:hypothetical protein